MEKRFSVELDHGGSEAGRSRGSGDRDHTAGNRFERRGDGLAFLPRGELHRVADQMHDAGLDQRLGKHRADRLREALQAVDHGNQDVVGAPVLDFGLTRRQSKNTMAHAGSSGRACHAATSSSTAETSSGEIFTP